MKIADNVEALELIMRIAGRVSSICPVLLWDDDGATLVDTGMPGQLELIRAAMAEHDLRLSLLSRIMLTHQDIDHIGGASALVEASHAEVYAHGGDIPYIQGELPLIKMNEERIAAMIQTLPEAERATTRALFAHPPRVQVNNELYDGQELPIHGGIVVIHTPGHTPGHVCLYLKKHRVLIAGDALRVEEGILVGPNPSATPDMKTATESLMKLLRYDIDRVICYHGGLSPTDASARIRQLCAE